MIREDLLSSRTFQHMHGKAIWLSPSNICILQKKKKSNSTSDLEILHSQIPTFKQGLVWTWYKNKNISSNYIHFFFKYAYYGAIFLSRFRLYMLSFMFRFMFANICFEENQNSKKHEIIKFYPLQVWYVKHKHE